LTSEFVGFLVTVALALVTPTVWALVLGAILTLAMRAALSYFIPHPRHRIVFDRAAAVEILSFGKWITISSFVVYAATNLDRIYLGKLLPLQILGVFGLARAIADLPPTLAQRLTYQVVFPAIARARARSEQIAKSDLAAIRLRFLVFASATMATMIAWSDWAIRLLYDQRYQAAGWMLFVLMMGAWVAVLSSLNEAVLLGFGHPKVNGLANVSRVFVLSLGLPAGYFLFGLAGAVIVVAASELSRYVLLVAGQERICFSFWKQDTTATTVVFACLVGWLLVRHAAGLGMPWNGMVFEGQVP
jgi:O-antigen/teichoic acid export membrane protein